MEWPPSWDSSTKKSMQTSTTVVRCRSITPTLYPVPSHSWPSRFDSIDKWRTGWMLFTGNSTCTCTCTRTCTPGSAGLERVPRPPPRPPRRPPRPGPQRTPWQPGGTTHPCMRNSPSHLAPPGTWPAKDAPCYDTIYTRYFIHEIKYWLSKVLMQPKVVHYFWLFM